MFLLPSSSPIKGMRRTTRVASRITTGRIESYRAYAPSLSLSLSLTIPRERLGGYPPSPERAALAHERTNPGCGIIGRSGPISRKRSHGWRAPRRLRDQGRRMRPRTATWGPTIAPRNPKLWRSRARGAN
jgi:hypothetical protein